MAANYLWLRARIYSFLTATHTKNARTTKLTYYLCAVAAIVREQHVTNVVIKQILSTCDVEQESLLSIMLLNRVPSNFFYGVWMVRYGSRSSR